MRTTVVIHLGDDGFMATANDQHGVAFELPKAGLTPADAAATAAALMVKFAVNNPDGGEVMAIPEVLALIPEHLRSVDGKPKRLHF